MGTRTGATLVNGEQTQNVSVTRTKADIRNLRVQGTGDTGLVRPDFRPQARASFGTGAHRLIGANAPAGGTNTTNIEHIRDTHEQNDKSNITTTEHIAKTTRLNHRRT